MNKKSLYEILEVNQRADDESIRRSYRRLVLKYHPDRNPGNDAATERLKEINAAYDVLKDPQKRAAYDRWNLSATGDETGDSAPYTGAKSRSSHSYSYDYGYSESRESSSQSADGEWSKNEDRQENHDVSTDIKVTFLFYLLFFILVGIPFVLGLTHGYKGLALFTLWAFGPLILGCAVWGTCTTVVKRAGHSTGCGSIVLTAIVTLSIIAWMFSILDKL